MPDEVEAELIRIPLRGDSQDQLIEIVQKHAGGGRGSFAIAQEGNKAFLHVAIADARELKVALEKRDIAHFVIPPLRLDLFNMGLSEPALNITEKLIAGGVFLAGLTSNRAAAPAGEEKTNDALRSMKENCASMTEIASGYASGVAGEVTLIGDIEPSTYEKAINDAYANALAASAHARLFVDSACTEPCVCRYTVTFAPEATQTTSVVEVKASASGQRAAVEVSASVAGNYKTVTAWVRWTLWQGCITGAEAEGSASPSTLTGTMSVGSQTLSHPCPTRSRHGTVNVHEDWTWTISASLGSAPDDPNVALVQARDAIRRKAVERCVEECTKSLLQLETCPSHCPKTGNASVVIEPPLVTVSPRRRVTGIASYYYEATITATGAWAVFRPCCPSE